jgi:hypothetical protein
MYNYVHGYVGQKEGEDNMKMKAENENKERRRGGRGGRAGVKGWEERNKRG